MRLQGRRLLSSEVGEFILPRLPGSELISSSRSGTPSTSKPALLIRPRTSQLLPRLAAAANRSTFPSSLPPNALFTPPPLPPRSPSSRPLPPLPPPPTHPAPTSFPSPHTSKCDTPRAQSGMRARRWRAPSCARSRRSRAGTPRSSRRRTFWRRSCARSRWRTSSWRTSWMSSF